MSDVSTESLWERFHGELFAYLRPRVDSEAMARDILQTAFLRAHEHLVAGDVPEHPRAWLYQIVRNLRVDAQRSAGRQLALADAVAREPAPVAEDEPDTDAFALVARALPMFIDALDEPYRSALRMTELEGLTQAEAAARAGVSISGMKSRTQRGRKRVFDSLQRCCAFDLDARGHVIDYKRRGAKPGDCC